MTAARLAACLAWLAVIPRPGLGEVAEPRSPILITFDLHMDPLGGIPDPVLRDRVFREWCAAAAWLLDQTEPRGAKLSFSMVGEFAERCLANPEATFPLLKRLYDSGGSLGTHSHTWIRQAPFVWIDMLGRPGDEPGRQVWKDDVGLVDELVARLYDLKDPAKIRGINNLRGSHLPADPRAWQTLARDYGFRIVQAGPGEDFAGLFGHYLYHPFRPSAALGIAEDRHAPAVLTQAGPVLGQVAVHKNVPQDMRLERLQAQFLGEVLNWLHDAETDAPDRVWCFGWGTHGSDVAPRGVSRKVVGPALDWFDRYFVGRSLGGRVVARYGSYRDEAAAYEAWEPAHPDTPSRSYPARERDWSLYPWLVPVAAYLWDATYSAAVRADEKLQAHRLLAPQKLGGPYPIVVAFPVGPGPVELDLTAVQGGEWQSIDPASGQPAPVPAGAAPVSVAGALFVPAASYRPLADQERAIDAAYDRALPQMGPGRSGPRRGFLANFDRDGDGKVAADEFPGPRPVFEHLDRNHDGFVDSTEAAAAPPPPGTPR
ncbi:MAG: hypothetical protein HYU66_29710 [Armatimonadetes bacterium]|nr:hypothetical protein [Armatimonadota bacterium]